MIKVFKEWMGLLQLSYLSMLKMSAKSFFLNSCLKKKADAVIGQNETIILAFTSVFSICVQVY